MVISAGISVILLVFAVDWRYVRDWVVVYLYKSMLDSFFENVVIKKGLIEYPVRPLPQYFDGSLLFGLLVFPALCIVYNQITRNKGLWPIFYYAVLFSAGIVAVEYPLELYTNLITYIKWSWFTSLWTLTLTFLSSRAFIALYRWSCSRFGQP